MGEVGQLEKKALPDGRPTKRRVAKGAFLFIAKRNGGDVEGGSVAAVIIASNAGKEDAAESCGGFVVRKKV